MSFNTFGIFSGPPLWREPWAAIGCVVDGCPPRIALTEADIHPIRQAAPAVALHHATAQPDEVKILSGLFIDEPVARSDDWNADCLLIDKVDQVQDYSDIKESTGRPRTTL